MTNLSELTGAYTIDPSHSQVGFVARHAMITKVRGTFDDFHGTATVDATEPAASTVEVTIQVPSVDTRSADRDNHLRNADFFDVERYPTITFRSTDVRQTGDDTLELTGDLTIKGVTRPVTIPFQFEGQAQDPFGNTRIGFSGRTKVNREDFGLTWNAALETGGLLVSKEITLEFEVSAIKAA